MESLALGHTVTEAGRGECVFYLFASSGGILILSILNSKGNLHLFAVAARKACSVSCISCHTDGSFSRVVVSLVVSCHMFCWCGRCTLESLILFTMLQEKKLERHCRSATTCNALYVTLLGKTIAW